MSFLDKLSALLPFSKKEEELEYYFALNISPEQLTASLWTIQGKHLKILDTAVSVYTSSEEIAKVTDQLLDKVLGVREIEPKKILFGVPDSWLQDEELKEEYSKQLRSLVKELELEPLAYVAISHALIHFLEKTEGIPPTAILVGFVEKHLEVIVVRAGKLDGVKVVARGETSGADIEKALLTFTDVETLPSKILIYGASANLEKLKTQLLSFSWMSKLSFLHFPKIEVLEENLEIKSVCFAGASEVYGDVTYTEDKSEKVIAKPMIIKDEENLQDLEDSHQGGVLQEATKESEVGEQVSDIGFVVGDVSKNDPNLDTEKKGKTEDMGEIEVSEQGLDETDESQESVSETKMTAEEEIREERSLVAEAEDFEEMAVEQSKTTHRGKLIPFIPKFLHFRFGKNIPILLGVVGVIFILLGFYLFMLKAEVKVFVEPKILERDTQVIADPNIKEVNEAEKKIPGQIVSTEVSGIGKETASGKKQIGDSAKGTVVLRNKTDASKNISKGTVMTSSSGFKFSLDTSVTIASRSADDGTWGKVEGSVTAQVIGPDSNLPSGTDLKVGSLSESEVIAKSEGNFSGGTSKDVTVVSDADQKKLLASLSSELRSQAKQKLQEQLPDKKILEEALSEEIIKKNFSKNVNDQASEFSLNLTLKFKGTAFEDKDLRQIVSKLVTTDVPSGFELNLVDSETQADVSKLEKEGKIIFLARFKAKLMPKLDIDKIKNEIKGKTAKQAIESLKSFEHVLGSEIKIIPNLPTFLQRLPILEKNINVEVGLK